MALYSWYRRNAGCSDGLTQTCWRTSQLTASILSKKQKATCGAGMEPPGTQKMLYGPKLYGTRFLRGAPLDASQCASRPRCWREAPVGVIGLENRAICERMRVRLLFSPQNFALYHINDTLQEISRRVFCEFLLR